MYVLFPPEVPRLLCCLVELLLQFCDAPLEQTSRPLVQIAAVGDPDPDEDPDDQGEKDGRERRDVVPEVEHLRAPRQSGTARAAG
jgi:hypothetical protein